MNSYIFELQIWKSKSQGMDRSGWYHLGYLNGIMSGETAVENVAPEVMNTVSSSIRGARLVIRPYDKEVLSIPFDASEIEKSISLYRSEVYAPRETYTKTDKIMYEMQSAENGQWKHMCYTKKLGQNRSYVRYLAREWDREVTRE